MTRGDLIREFNVEERVDDIIRLVADADVITRVKQRVVEFMDERCSEDCNCVSLAKDLLNGLETFQNHLRTLMDAHRDAVIYHLVSCIASWFVGYYVIAEETAEEFEYFIDELIGEALADLEGNIPLYGIKPTNNLEREFVELSRWVMDQLEDQLHGEDIVNQVLDHIRF